MNREKLRERAFSIFERSAEDAQIIRGTGVVNNSAKEFVVNAALERLLQRERAAYGMLRKTDAACCRLKA